MRIATSSLGHLTCSSPLATQQTCKAAHEGHLGDWSFVFKLPAARAGRIIISIAALCGKIAKGGRVLCCECMCRIISQ